MTTSGSCPVVVTSNSVTITVAKCIDVCEGNSVTLNANIPDQKPDDTVQWFVNGSSYTGATNTVFTYVPANKDTVTCRLNYNDCGSPGAKLSNTVIITTIYPCVVASVSIVETENNICTATPVSVTYTATPTNGGTSPTYQWKVNGSNVGGNTPTYSYTPTNDDVITCEMTSSEVGAAPNPAISNAITMIITKPRTPKLKIIAVPD